MKVVTPTSGRIFPRLLTAVALVAVSIFLAVGIRARKTSVAAADANDSSAPPPRSNRDLMPAPTSAARVRSKNDLFAELHRRLAAGASLQEIREALESLAATQPATAMDLALALARGDAEKYQLAAAVSEIWAQKDSPAAWAWALAQSPQLNRPGETNLLAIVLNAVAKLDPQQVVTLAGDTLESGAAASPSTDNDSAAVAQFAVQALLQTGHADLARRAVEQWARADLPEPLGNAAYETVALDLAKTSATSASDWLHSLPISEERNLAFATLAADWAATAPQAAIDWAMKLDPADGRTDAMQRAFDRWATQDLVAAAQWLGDNESHSTADGMIAFMIGDSTLGETNPQLAMKWVALIADPNLRGRSLEQVVLSWGRHDPAEAARYVGDSATLTPEQKDRLGNLLRQRASRPPGAE